MRQNQAMFSLASLERNRQRRDMSGETAPTVNNGDVASAQQRPVAPVAPKPQNKMRRTGKSFNKPSGVMIDDKYDPSVGNRGDRQDVGSIDKNPKPNLWSLGFDNTRESMQQVEQYEANRYKHDNSTLDQYQAAAKEYAELQRIRANNRGIVPSGMRERMNELEGIISSSKENLSNRDKILNQRGQSIENVGGMIKQDLYYDFLNNYAPIEEQQMRYATADYVVPNALEDNHRTVRQQFIKANGEMGRNLSRYGLTQSKRQKADHRRSSKLQQALAEIEMDNYERSSINNSRAGVLGDLIESGRSDLNRSVGIIESLSGSEADREYANDVADANKKAQNTQTAVGVLSALATAAVAVMSSIEFKENVEPIPEGINATELLKQLELYTFNYKEETPFDDPSKLKFGPLAEQLPELLLSSDGKGVDMYNMIFMLLRSIQELTDRLNKLEGDNDA